MTLKINGVDITPYIANRGIKWERSDVEAADTGRTMDGKMHRGRVATKIRLDITCRPLTGDEAKIILNAIFPQYINVTYDDPMYGLRRDIKMYSNNNPASYLMEKDDAEYWDGITFPLIEV